MVTCTTPSLLVLLKRSFSPLAFVASAPVALSITNHSIDNAPSAHSQRARTRGLLRPTVGLATTAKSPLKSRRCLHFFRRVDADEGQAVADEGADALDEGEAEAGFVVRLA